MIRRIEPRRGSGNRPLYEESEFAVDAAILAPFKNRNNILPKHCESG